MHHNIDHYLNLLGAILVTCTLIHRIVLNVLTLILSVKTDTVNDTDKIVFNVTDFLVAMVFNF